MRVRLAAAFAVIFSAWVATASAQSGSGGGFERMQTTDSLGRTITFHVARPATSGPLLLLVQGSGCELLADPDRGGRIGGFANAMRTIAAGRVTVLVVEKPFAGLPPGGQRGTATDCSRRFNEEHTAERWREALMAATEAASKLPYVDPTRSLAFGHSEGARMAATMAGTNPRFTHAAIMAGGGAGQAYDTLISAYQRGNTTAERLDNLEKAEAQIRAVMLKPDSVDDFAWGHPYRRWSSFFRLSAADELKRSKARVYLASGTADQNVPFISTQLLAATLLAEGRDVTVRRIPDADHSLRPSGAKDSSDTIAEYRLALDWFLTR